jgi:hypothetical protein
MALVPLLGFDELGNGVKLDIAGAFINGAWNRAMNVPWEGKDKIQKTYQLCNRDNTFRSDSPS